MTTLSTTRQRNIDKFKIDPQSRMVKESLVDQFINDGIDDLTVSAPWEQTSATITTVADQREYDQPTGFLDVESVVYPNASSPLLPMDHPDVLKLIGNTDVSGTPEYYYTRADKIGFEPIPGTSGLSITVYYWKFDADLTAASDVVPVWGKFNHVLDMYVQAWMWFTIGRMEKFDRLIKLYENKKQEVLDILDSLTTDERGFRVNDLDEDGFLGNDNTVGQY